MPWQRPNIHNMRHPVHGHLYMIKIFSGQQLPIFIILQINNDQVPGIILMQYRRQHNFRRIAENDVGLSPSWKSTILFLINAPRALHFSNRGCLYESNIERENSYKLLLKLRNYHKMMNYELWTLCQWLFNSNPWFVLLFSVITNPVSMCARLQTQSSMDINWYFVTF